MTLPGTGLVHQPSAMAEWASSLIPALSLPSRPMTWTNAVGGGPLSPCLCSRSRTQSCVPVSVFKLGSIKFIRICFSKLQLQFGFVSLKLYPGPFDWGLNILNVSHAFAIFWFISKDGWTHDYVWILQVVFQRVNSFLNVCRALWLSHVLSMCVMTASPLSEVAHSPHGNQSISRATVPMRGMELTVPIFPKFLNKEGAVSVEVLLELSKSYKIIFIIEKLKSCISVLLQYKVPVFWTVWNRKQTQSEYSGATQLMTTLQSQQLHGQ